MRADKKETHLNEADDYNYIDHLSFYQSLFSSYGVGPAKIHVTEEKETVYSFLVMSFGMEIKLQWNEGTQRT